MMRIGQGCDFHRFAEGRKLMLGGFHVNGCTGLAGHSDADVLLHAISDAVLGALALGDIGSWFPPRESRWKDVESSRIVTAVWESPELKDWQLVNLDATVICEYPKLRPHIDNIRQSIASIFSVGTSCISVKATTTEGMGFIGRKEGMASNAVVLLEKNSV